MSCESTSVSFIQVTGGVILGIPPITSGTSASPAIEAQAPTSCALITPGTLPTATRTATAMDAENSVPVPTTTVGQASSSGLDIFTPSKATSVAVGTATINQVPLSGPHISTPSQKWPASAATATAIGAGVGVPLGITAAGFLGFLFWQETRRRKIHRFQGQTSEKDQPRGLNGASKNGRGEPGELLGFEVPWELDPRAVKVELPDSRSELR